MKSRAPLRVWRVLLADGTAVSVQATDCSHDGGSLVFTAPIGDAARPQVALVSFPEGSVTQVEES